MPAPPSSTSPLQLPQPPQGLATPHRGSGRGSLLTCGDIVENPGPEGSTHCPGDMGPPIGQMIDDQGAAFMAQYGLEAFFPLLSVPRDLTLSLPQPPASSSTSAIVSARTAGGRKKKRMRAQETILCPLGCSEPFISDDAVLAHVESIHILRGGVAPDDGWLASMGRRLCQGCRRLMARSSSHCPGCRRQQQEERIAGMGPLGPGTPLSQPEPPMRPSLAMILGDRRGVLEHVPRGCRASVLQALGRVLHNFCTHRTWESLRDLLGFGKAVLAAPKRGGHRRLQALEREVILRANALGTSSFEALWARTATPGKAGKPKSRLPRLDATTPHHSHQVVPEEVVSRVSALVGEGALSKACKVLLSTGVWDPEDPRVSRKLQDLHPVTGPPDLSPPSLGIRLGIAATFPLGHDGEGESRAFAGPANYHWPFPPRVRR